jgi:hypothetical protein
MRLVVVEVEHRRATRDRTFENIVVGTFDNGCAWDARP